MFIQSNIFSNLRSLKNASIKHLLGLKDIKNSVNIYTDGSYKASSNLTKIGFAFIVKDNDTVVHIQRGSEYIGKRKRKLGALTAETIAIEKALKYIYKKDFENTMIHTDSLYIYKAIYGYSEYLNPVLSHFINKIKIMLYKLKDNNQSIDFKYIKSHTYIDNNLADLHAKKGRKS